MQKQIDAMMKVQSQQVQCTRKNMKNDKGTHRCYVQRVFMILFACHALIKFHQLVLWLPIVLGSLLVTCLVVPLGIQKIYLSLTHTGISSTLEISQLRILHPERRAISLPTTGQHNVCPIVDDYQHKSTAHYNRYFAAISYCEEDTNKNQQ